ncbi:chitin-binding domain-containing protein [Psychroflexus tropicus]
MHFYHNCQNFSSCQLCGKPISFSCAKGQVFINSISLAVKE